MEQKKTHRDSKDYDKDLADSGVTIQEIQKMLDSFAEKEKPKKINLAKRTSNNDSITPEILERLNIAREDNLYNNKIIILGADVESLIKLTESSAVLKQAVISSPEEVMAEFMDFEFRYKLANDSELTKLRYLAKFIKHKIDMKESQQFIFAACVVFCINLGLLAFLPITIPFVSTFMNIFGWSMMYKGYRYNGGIKIGIGNRIKSLFSRKSKLLPNEEKLTDKLDEVGDFYKSLKPRSILHKNGKVYVVGVDFSDRTCYFELLVDTTGNISLKKSTVKP